MTRDGDDDDHEWDVVERVHEKEKNEVCFGNHKRVQTIIGAETQCI